MRVNRHEYENNYSLKSINFVNQFTALTHEDIYSNEPLGWNYLRMYSWKVDIRKRLMDI